MTRALRRSLPILGVGVVVALAMLLSFARVAPSSTILYQAEQAEYVGSDLCQECHTDQSATFESSIHAGLDWTEIDWPHDYEADVDIACESCHGPGSTHVEMAGTEEPGFREAIVSFDRATANETADQCLTCHAQQESQQHFGLSEHLRGGVTCADCHNSHQSLTVDAALAAPEPALCYECHGDKRGEFALPERHPVNEGFMTCSDCHSPHGTTNRLQLTRAGNVLCADCHQDKEGPFVFPHVAAEAEGCVICHTPHGSVTPHLLAKADISLVCYQCHQAPFGLAPPSFHREDSRDVCTECHYAIHGSNLDPKFMR